MNKPNSIDNKDVLESINQWEIWLKDVIQMAHDKLANTLLSQVDEKDFSFVKKMRRPQDLFEHIRLNHIDLHLKAKKKAKIFNMNINELINIDWTYYIILDDNKLYEIAEKDSKVVILYEPISKEYTVVQNNPTYKVLLDRLKYAGKTSLPNLYNVTFLSFSLLNTSRLNLEWWFHHEAFFYADDQGNFTQFTNLWISLSEINEHWKSFYYQSDSPAFTGNSLYIKHTDQTIEFKDFLGTIFPLISASGTHLLLIANHRPAHNLYSLVDVDNWKVLLENVDWIQVHGKRYPQCWDNFEKVQIDFNWPTSFKNDYYKFVVNNEIRYASTSHRFEKMKFLWTQFKVDNITVE